ncbi:MAG: hypothetical protein Q8R88_17460, partial [Desulfoprunum sp.]|nr:hypothetical protein [Desulfoprunum sp.]
QFSHDATRITTVASHGRDCDTSTFLLYIHQDRQIDKLTDTQRTLALYLFSRITAKVDGNTQTREHQRKDADECGVEPHSSAGQDVM